TLKRHAERFLDLAGTKQQPLTFRELRQFVRSLYDLRPAGGGGERLLWGDMDVSAIDEARGEGGFLGLGQGDGASPTKKKRWGFFKRMVRYFWENRLIELPRNLDSTSMEFRAQAKKIRSYTAKQVKGFLDDMPERLRVFALLGLNCGMTAADMG